MEEGKIVRQKILIVDDDVNVNSMISEYFQENRFEVTSAFNGKEAVEKEELKRPDLVMMDVGMPVMNGLEACRIIREKRNGNDYTPIIFLSGSADEEMITTGLHLGADDYIRKPYAFLELLCRVNNLIKMKNFMTQLGSMEHIIINMIKSIEGRDYITTGHSQRVSDLSASIGREMGLSEYEKENLRKGALLHDIGKIGISDQVLNKTDKITKVEFGNIKKHCEIGMNICSNLCFTPLVMDIIHHHHEKLDGTGYPDGLKENEIHKLVRIVTAADIYDALITEKPYRGANSKEEALKILEQETLEGKLDQGVVNCLKKLVTSTDKYFY